MLPEINQLVEQPATLHTVKNFNPADYLTCYTNSKGTNVYYLEVKYRILWFRLCYPLGRIQVKILQNDAEQIIAEARVYTDMTMPDDQFIGQAIAHKYKTVAMAEGYDLLEWTCTAAVGRALGIAGFGQQFCDILPSYEPEEVDSPASVLPTAAPQAATANGQAAPSGQTEAENQKNDKKKTSSRKSKTQTKPSDAEKKQTVAGAPPADDITADWDISEAVDFGDALEAETTPAVQSSPGQNGQPTAQSAWQQHAQSQTMQAQKSQAKNQSNSHQNTAGNKSQAASQQANNAAAKPAPTNLEEALQILSPQDCLELTINFGFNQGKCLGDLYRARDMKSLDWLANSYKGRDFTIKAGAQILLSRLQAS